MLAQPPSCCSGPVSFVRNHMDRELPAHVNPWFALKHSGVQGYIVASASVVCLSLLLSVATQNWTWASRSGGILVLFGVLLSLRRMFRLGPQRFDEPPEPVIINGSQFNMNVIHQDIQRAGDNFAQTSGIALIIFGTLLGSYGDIFLEWLYPIGGM